MHALRQGDLETNVHQLERNSARLKKGNCPRHDRAMRRIDPRKYIDPRPFAEGGHGGAFAVVACPQPGCMILARRFGMQGPFRLVAKWASLVLPESVSAVGDEWTERNCWYCSDCNGQGLRYCTACFDFADVYDCRKCYGQKLALCHACLGSGEFHGGYPDCEMVRDPAIRKAQKMQDTEVESAGNLCCPESRRWEIKRRRPKYSPRPIL